MNCGYVHGEFVALKDGLCVPCADLSPIETELVAQARLITNAKYEAREQNFREAMVDERLRNYRGGRSL